MGSLKVILVVLALSVVHGRRLPFSRGYRRTPFSLGKPMYFLSPSYRSLGEMPSYWLDASDPWSPRIVQIEVTHELHHKPILKVEDDGWKPIVPSWKHQKSTGIWKAKDHDRINPWKYFNKHEFEDESISEEEEEPVKHVYVPEVYNSPRSPYIHHFPVTKPLYSSQSQHQHQPFYSSHSQHQDQPLYTSNSQHQYQSDIEHDSEESSEEESDEQSDRNYKFTYGVESSETGDFKSHEERKNDGIVIGKYTVKEPDGSTREVHYTAGKDIGFKAVVVNTGGSQANHLPSDYNTWGKGQHKHNFRFLQSV